MKLSVLLQRFALICLVAILLCHSVFKYMEYQRSSEVTLHDLNIQKLNSTLTQLNKELKNIMKKNADMKSLDPSSHIQSSGSSSNSGLLPSSLPSNVSSLRRTEDKSKGRRVKRAVIFTMDSIESYEQNSLHGGAAGG